MPAPDPSARRTCLLVGDSNVTGVATAADWTAAGHSALLNQNLRLTWWRGPNAARNAVRGWENYQMGTNSNWWQTPFAGGCEASMIERMSERWGGYPGVFKFGLGQTSLHSFNPVISWLKASAQLYTIMQADWALASADAIAAWPFSDLGVRVIGIILGAVDATNSAAGTAFAANLQQFLTDLDADIGQWASDVPVYYGVCRIPSWYRDAIGTAASTAVYTGCQTACTAFGARAVLVDTDGLTHVGDNTHFDAASLYTLGRNIVNVYP